MSGVNFLSMFVWLPCMSIMVSFLLISPSFLKPPFASGMRVSLCSAFPAPGLAANITTSPSTNPPPRTLSSSPIPVAVRCIGLLFSSLMLEAFLDGFLAAADFSPGCEALPCAGADVAATSVKSWNAPHDWHFPIGLREYFPWHWLHW